MIIKDFSKQPSILNHCIAELRDVQLQRDRRRFRENLENIGAILGYELSKSLNYQRKNISTPLGVKSMDVLIQQPLLCTILRAGLPMHTGLLRFFHQAETTFVSAFRRHKQDAKSFEIFVDYLATPSLEGKILIISDPMLATGESLVSVYKSLRKHGTPRSLHLVVAVAAQQGIDHIIKNLPEKTTLWAASIDEKLNDKSYIVPGLGDAGDLAFGKRI